MTQFTRRDFLKFSAVTAAAGLAVGGSACSGGQGAKPAQRYLAAAPSGSQAYLSVARGDDPAALTRAAIASLGGIERFVKTGHDVIIKPNICVDYHTPEYAATTNPVVVAELVKLCVAAGAKRVRVMDHPLGGTAESAYKISGIGDAVAAAGGVMESMSSIHYQRYTIPDGKAIKAWEVYREAMNADVLINVPIAKDHALARLSLGGKNLLGLVTKANQYHQDLGQRVADLDSLIKPTLTVMDAYRVLMAHGPTGGSLDDVKLAKTVIASHDMVAVDSYSATLFDLTGADIAYVKAASEMGLGTMDLKSIKVEEISA
jgi:uncharacterized protein (DUF362 family)